MNGSSNTVSEPELFQWYGQNKDTPKLKHVFGRGSPSAERQATIWFQEQFDVRQVWRALRNEPPERHRMDREGQWDVYRVVRALVEMAENPKTPLTVKFQCLDRIREYHRLGAAMHPEFAVNTNQQRKEVLRRDEEDSIANDAFTEMVQNLEPEEQLPDFSNRSLFDEAVMAVR